MSAKIALVLALLGSGCSLIVDVESVRRERDAGAIGGGDSGGGAIDGGGGDVGGGDSGGGDGGGGGDSGGGANDGATNPDAQPACARPDAGLLSCAQSDLPLTFPSKAAIEGDADQLIAAVASPGAIHVFRLDETGQILDRDEYPTSTPVSDLALSIAGGEYAVAWIAGEGRVQCRSSLTTSSSTSITPPEAVRDVSVALAPSGAISLVATMPFFFSTAIYNAESAAGCPAQLQLRNPLYYTRGVATAWVPLRSAFRYSLSAIHPNLEDSALVIHDADAQNTRFYVYTGDEIGGVAHVPSSDGNYLLQLFGYGLDTSQSLTVTLQPSDISSATLPDRVVPLTATAFDLANCGAGCAVAAVLSDEVGGRISSAFFSDDASLRFIGDTMYDVDCEVASFAAGIDVGYGRGKLAFLHADNTRAALYLCEKPF